MAITVVQAVAAGGTTSVTSGSITTTTGNLVIAAAFAATAAPTLSDSRSNTYTAVASNITNVNGAYEGVYICANITGGATTYTASTSVGNSVTVIAVEISGCSTTQDQADAANSDTAFTLSKAGATVTAAAGDIVLAFSMSGLGAGSNVYTPNGGWTIPSNGSILGVNLQAFVQYINNVSAGSYTGAYTQSQTTPYGQVIVALKPGAPLFTPFTTTQFFSKRKIIQR